MAPIRRTPRRGAARKANPLRDLLSSPEDVAVRSRARENNLAAKIPSLIEDQVQEQFERLESRLVEDFRKMGQKVVEKSTAAITDQLAGRIDTLEKISATQTETLVTLQHTTGVTEARVRKAVNSIEKTLSGAVSGGFQLQPQAHVLRALPEGGEQSAIVKADPREIEEADGRIGYCPKCTSANVRRAMRSGLLEEFLRLFFIAPFRCKACRHKFYKF